MPPKMKSHKQMAMLMSGGSPLSPSQKARLRREVRSGKVRVGRKPRSGKH